MNRSLKLVTKSQNFHLNSILARNYVKALKPQEIQNALNTVPGWEYHLEQSQTQTQQRDIIQRNFVFKDFDIAWEFMSQVANVAKEMDHHPEWFNVYNRVNVVLSTHDAKGLSEKDFKLAKRMNEIEISLKQL